MTKYECLAAFPQSCTFSFLQHSDKGTLHFVEENNEGCEIQNCWLAGSFAATLLRKLLGDGPAGDVPIQRLLLLYNRVHNWNQDSRSTMIEISFLYPFRTPYMDGMVSNFLCNNIAKSCVKLSVSLIIYGAI